MSRTRKGYTQLSVYLPTPIHRAFRTLCLDSEVSMTEWIAEKVEEAVRETGYYRAKPVQNYDTLADFVRDNLDLLKNSKITQDHIDAMLKGKKPNELNLLRLATTLRVDIDELHELYARSFDD